MKRLLACLSLVVLLSGCGGGSSTTIVCTSQYWNGAFGLCLPADWAVVEREKLAERGVPDQVLAAFQANQAVSGQTPTITVTSEKLSAPLDAMAYSQASIRSVSVLPGYTLIDSRTVQIEGQNVQLHIFSAQPVSDQPARRFYQLSTVSANAGYTFTALTPVAVSDTLEKEIVLILDSVRFTPPSSSK